METEEILFELDQLRIKHKGRLYDIEQGSPRIDESIELLESWKSEVCKKQREECAATIEKESECKDHEIIEAVCYLIRNASEPT